MARENMFKMNKDKDDTNEEQRTRIFQKDGNTRKRKRLRPSTVMFVPNTRRGTLLKKLKEKEERLADMTGFKVNYIEAGGTDLGSVLS